MDFIEMTHQQFILIIMWNFNLQMDYAVKDDLKTSLFFKDKVALWNKNDFISILIYNIQLTLSFVVLQNLVIIL